MIQKSGGGVGLLEVAAGAFKKSCHFIWRNVPYNVH